MAEFDFAGLDPIKSYNFPGKYPIFGVVNSPDALGEATWKTEERRREMEKTPEYQEFLQKQYDEERKMQLMEESKAAVARQKEKEAYAKWEQNQILNKVSDSNFQKRLASGEINSSQALAEQAKAAAQESLNRGQAGYAKDFMDLAAKYEAEALTQQAAFERTQDSKRETARESLMDGDLNAVSWALAKDKLADAGINIPPEAMSWGPTAKKWAQEQSVLSKAGIAKEKLDLAQQLADERAKTAAEKKLAAEAKAQQKASDDALKRELQPTTKRMSKDEIGMFTKELSKNEEFKDLSNEDKLTAANEFNLVQRYLLSTGQAKTAAEARSMAVDDILSRIQDGKLSKFAPDGESKDSDPWKVKLGDKWKPGYKYWIENGRIKGEPL